MTKNHSRAKRAASHEYGKELHVSFRSLLNRYGGAPAGELPARLYHQSAISSRHNMRLSSKSCLWNYGLWWPNTFFPPLRLLWHGRVMTVLSAWTITFPRRMDDRGREPSLSWATLKDLIPTMYCAKRARAIPSTSIFRPSRRGGRV